MCPSTSRLTWAGSQLGIWPAIAVTMPNANEENASSARIRRMRKSRSLRILRRRPLPDASSLRLRRNKRPILAPSLGGNPDQRDARRQIDAVRLLGDHYGRAPWDVTCERHGGDRTGGYERACRLRRAAVRDPGLVDPSVAGRRKIAQDQGGGVIGSD